VVNISQAQVKHIAQLACLQITAQEATQLEAAFKETLGVVANLNRIEVSGVEPTHQVTGLENVWREDKVDGTHTLDQTAALKNAKQIYNGFFVVPRLIDQK